MNVYVVIGPCDGLTGVCASLETARELAGGRFEWTLASDPAEKHRQWESVPYEFRIKERPLLWTPGDDAVPTLITEGVRLELVTPTDAADPVVRVTAWERQRGNQFLIRAEAVE